MPSSLVFTSLTWPTAELGPEGSLALLGAPQELHLADPTLVADAAMADGFARGRVTSLLPFRGQSAYGRTLRETEHAVAVLEGDRLRATFLLGLGGRLWSLVDRASGRELLYHNAALQFGNLAIRDAWFAGGVEWNTGLIGHTPLTCAPLHAGRVDGPDGPVLRLWEFDRLRDTVYSVDAWLDDQTGLLCVRPEIHNPNGHAVDTYWWSNAAVPQTDATRVIVPADAAWYFAFGEAGLTRVAVGTPDGDVTYPARFPGSADYFFDLAGTTRPWIAAVEPDGRGYLQTSTAPLQGRKLFRWGRGPGGRHWQRWLSPLGGEYLEVQAGLARTQMEHVALAAGASFTWVETYGPLTADPAAVGADWATARGHVAALVAAGQPDAWLEALAARADAVALVPPTLEHAGSGWGAVERRRRQRASDTSLDRAGTPFPDTLIGPAEAAWIDLLERGAFPAADPLRPPGSHQAAAGWLPYLDTDASWRGRLHAGEIHWRLNNPAQAQACWRASLAAAPNPWAWRNLGLAARAAGDDAAARHAYAQACGLAGDDPDLALERLAGLSGQDLLDVVDALPESLRSRPRVRLAEAGAALAAGDTGRAVAALTPLPEVANLREGELALADLWARLQAALGTDDDLPEAWDFQM